MLPASASNDLRRPLLPPSNTAGGGSKRSQFKTVTTGNLQGSHIGNSASDAECTEKDASASKIIKSLKGSWLPPFRGFALSPRVKQLRKDIPKQFNQFIDGLKAEPWFGDLKETLDKGEDVDTVLQQFLDQVPKESLQCAAMILDNRELLTKSSQIEDTNPLHPTRLRPVHLAVFLDRPDYLHIVASLDTTNTIQDYVKPNSRCYSDESEEATPSFLRAVSQRSDRDSIVQVGENYACPFTIAALAKNVPIMKLLLKTIRLENDDIKARIRYETSWRDIDDDIMFHYSHNLYIPGALLLMAELGYYTLLKTTLKARVLAEKPIQKSLKKGKKNKIIKRLVEKGKIEEACRVSRNFSKRLSSRKEFEIPDKYLSAQRSSLPKQMSFNDYILASRDYELISLCERKKLIYPTPPPFTFSNIASRLAEISIRLGPEDLKNLLSGILDNRDLFYQVLLRKKFSDGESTDNIQHHIDLAKDILGVGIDELVQDLHKLKDNQGEFSKFKFEVARRSPLFQDRPISKVSVIGPNHYIGLTNDDHSICSASQAGLELIVGSKKLALKHVPGSIQSYRLRLTRGSLYVDFHTHRSVYSMNVTNGDKMACKIIAVPKLDPEISLFKASNSGIVYAVSGDTIYSCGPFSFSAQKIEYKDSRRRNIRDFTIKNNQISVVEFFY